MTGTTRTAPRRRLEGAEGQGKPVTQAKLLAPVRWPGTIYCAGANYQDHAEEMWKAAGQPPQPDPHELGLKPWFFIKSSRAVTDPGATVQISNYSKKMDWEIELVVVIGRKARDLTIENALSCVAGYTVGNDLSARDLGFRAQLPETSPFRADWIRHKSFDGSCPLGPWITPAAYISDPSNLAMKLWVNDTLKQNSNSGQHDLHHCRADRASVDRHHALSRRHHHDRHARRRRRRPGRVPQGRATSVKIEIAEIGSLTNTMT